MSSRSWSWGKVVIKLGHAEELPRALVKTHIPEPENLQLQKAQRCASAAARTPLSSFALCEGILVTTVIPQLPLFLTMLFSFLRPKRQRNCSDNHRTCKNNLCLLTKKQKQTIQLPCSIGLPRLGTWVWKMSIAAGGTNSISPSSRAATVAGDLADWILRVLFHTIKRSQEDSKLHTYGVRFTYSQQISVKTFLYSSFSFRFLLIQLIAKFSVTIRWSNHTIIHLMLHFLKVCPKHNTF